MNTHNESSGMSMSLESGVVGAIIAKYGWLKLFTLSAALGGAALMAIFRPPKTRKEMFLQAAVALGCSILFGDTVVKWLDHFFDFIDLNTASWIDFLQFYVAVHGIVGALSWGVFGGMAHLRDKVGVDPIGTAKEIKDVVSK